MSQPRHQGRGRRAVARLLRNPKTGEFLFDVVKSVTSTVLSAGILYSLGALAGLYEGNKFLIGLLLVLVGGTVAVGLGWWLLPSKRAATATLILGLVLVFLTVWEDIAIGPTLLISSLLIWLGLGVGFVGLGGIISFDEPPALNSPPNDQSPS